MTDLLNFFETKREAMVELLTTMIEHESPSNDKLAVDRVGAFLHAQLENAGATIEIHEREQVGDILFAKWNADAADKPILILSHMDTVHPVGSVLERPVRVDDDGRLYGPGAADMKGGITIAMHAIMGLVERNELPERPIWFMITSDEEIGSKQSRELIEASAQESELVLVTEPPNADGSLKTWRKGVARFEIIVEGKAAHAGNEPEQGVNSIIEFAQHALEINQLNDLKNGTSVSVTTVQGGVTSNTIPARTVGTVDVRVMTDSAFRKVRDTIMERFPYIPGSNITVNAGHYRPPMERNGEVYEKAKAIAVDNGITVREDGAGGGSDGNFTAALGIPTLDGLGAHGAGLHADHEHIIINSLPQKAALMAAIIRDWDK